MLKIFLRLHEDENRKPNVAGKSIWSFPLGMLIQLKFAVLYCCVSVLLQPVQALTLQFQEVEHFARLNRILMTDIW